MFVKQLLPESSLPGVVIVLMPWLYAPVTWAFYNTVAQLVGDPHLTVGLILLSFGPMFYTMIGYKQKVVAPMDVESANRILNTMKWSMTAFSIVALTFIAFSMLSVGKVIEERATRVDSSAMGKVQDFASKQVMDLW